MKRSILIFSVIFSLPLFSQISSCFNATPICDDNVTIQNSVNEASLGNISCLGTSPNPKWFIFKIGDSGNFDFQLNQGNNMPDYNNQDIDYVIWGPFEHLPDCSSELYNYPSGNTSIADNLVSCSYSAQAVENFSLASAPSGKFYVVLSTNFSNNSGDIWLKHINAGQVGAGTLVCDYVIIDLQPENESFTTNNNATFTVSSLNGVSYKWEMSTNGVDWTILNDGGSTPQVIGTDTNALNLSNIPTSYSNYYFRVLVSNSNDSVYSKNAQLVQMLGTSSFDNSFVNVIYDSSNNITIRKNTSVGNIDYNLIDINGRSLKKASFNSDVFTIYLDDFNRGVYFLQLKSGDKSTIKKIFIN